MMYLYYIIFREGNDAPLCIEYLKMAADHDLPEAIEELIDHYGDCDEENANYYKKKLLSLSSIVNNDVN